jgi:hypothetical protein
MATASVRERERRNIKDIYFKKGIPKLKLYCDRVLAEITFAK